MNDRRAIAVLVAIATLFFADVLFLGNNFWFRDLFVYHYPMKHLVRAMTARGEFPWWNPYFANGQPMAANPAYEVFYPPQWLIFVGPFGFGFALHILFHVYVALLGAYLFFRSIPLRVDASFFGALSFGFSGFLLGTMTNLPTFFVWSWAGVVGWAVLRRIRGGAIGPAALAIAMPLLVFEPSSLLQMFALIVAGTLIVDRRAFLRVVAAMFAAAAICAVVLLPGLDHARDSVRSQGFTYEVAALHSMPLVRPIELIAPRALGVVSGELHAFWGYFFYGKHDTPYLLSLYCGVAVAILALAGLLTRRRGSLAVIAIGLTSYLLAAGGNSFLFPSLYRLGLRSIRYPEKFIAAALVTLIFFAATVADDLDDARLRRFALAIGSAIALLLLLTAAIVDTPVFLRLFAMPPAGAPLALIFRRMTLIAALIAGAWALILWRIRGSRTWRIAALALMLVDLAMFGNELLPRMPRSFFTPPPIVRAFDSDRSSYAIFHRGEWAQKPVASRNEAASLAWFARNGLRPYSPAAWDLRTALELDFDETYLLPSHALLARMKALGDSGEPHWSEPFMTVSNVRFAVDYRPPEQAIAEAKEGPPSWQPLAVERVRSQGRYWFARRLLPESEIVHAREGDACGAFPLAASARGAILAVRETSSSADLDVEASGAAMLIITITRHKYWRATIDGKPAELVPANIAYQALAVPAGRHHVALRYRNPMVMWGGAISAIALIALIPRRRRPRSGP